MNDEPQPPPPTTDRRHAETAMVADFVLPVPVGSKLIPTRGANVFHCAPMPDCPSKSAGPDPSGFWLGYVKPAGAVGKTTLRCPALKRSTLKLYTRMPPYSFSIHTIGMNGSQRRPRLTVRLGETRHVSCAYMAA